MAERAGIEALAVHFTAGVAAGALLLRLPADPVFLSSGLLLVLASLVVIVLKTERGGLLFPAFVLLGAFCAFTDAFPGADTTIFLERWTSAWAERLRAFIDGIPFPSAGTAPLLKALLTGDRSGLSADTVRVFRESGGAHLLALSGLHIGILYLLLPFHRPGLPVHLPERDRPHRLPAAGPAPDPVHGPPDPARHHPVGHHFHGLPALLPGDGGHLPALPHPGRLVSERRPLRSCPEDLGGSRPVHLLPGVHRPSRLVPVPHLPYLFPPHEPHRPALHHPPDGLRRDDARAPEHPLLPRVPRPRHGLAVPDPGLDPAGYFVNHCCPGFLVRATDWLCQTLVWILQVISSM